MPKRGNAARQDSAQGFAFRKDIAENIGLKLDHKSEGGVSGNLRRYHWGGKTSSGGTATKQPPIADVYDRKQMRRGGAGLWRRRPRKGPKAPKPEWQTHSANWAPGRGGDTRVAIPLTKKGMTMYRRRRKSRKHAKRRARQPMPGGGMPQGFGQGGQYGAPPMSMLGNLGGTGGM